MSAAVEGLSLHQVSIRLGSEILLEIDTHVARGEVLTIMGASGAGKSSLLAFIAGFLGRDFAASGRALLDGDDLTMLPAEQRHVGMLFQDPLLFPHLNVMGNMLFALPPGGSRAERRARAMALLEPVGLADLADRYPDALSGGQAARVALMRVVASGPRALLLDEPFAKLDMGLRESVRDFVFRCVAFQNLPAILVTHDPADAKAAGGPIFTL